MLLFKRTFAGPLLLVSSALFAGCDLLPPEAEKFWGKLQKEWDALIVVATGGRSPLVKDAVAPSPSPSVGTELYSSEAAKNAKANAELLHEVWQVVFVREPNDKGEFGSLVDTLNQGASFEGIYNGFTHSSDYRELEAANQGASPEALKLFGEELALLESEFAEPAEFPMSATRPLALPVAPSAEEGGGHGATAQGSDGVSTVEFGKTAVPVPSPAEAPAAGASGTPGKVVDTAALAEKYSRQFVGASIYTLKRVIGDEALRVVASKKDFREKLSLWYSKWVVRAASRGVDFGIPLRNKADERFHYGWALGSTEDRLQWEVLNRLHRLLNEANKPKQ